MRQVLRRTDVLGLLVAASWLVALLVYRANFVEPRELAAACALAAAPIACMPRAAVLWGQNWGLWGLSSLALGLAAQFGAPFGAPVGVSVAAVVLGIAGIVNYNATWGMLGLCLGAWAWIRPPRSAAPD